MISSRFQHAGTFKLLCFWFVISCTESFYYEIILTDFWIEGHHWEISLRSSWSLVRGGWINNLLIFLWLRRAIYFELVLINFRQSNFFKSWGIRRLSLINFGHTQSSLLKSGDSWTFSPDSWWVDRCAKTRKLYVVQLWLKRSLWIFLLNKLEWRICSVFSDPLSLCFLQSSHFICLRKSSDRINSHAKIFSIALYIWVDLAWFTKLFIMQRHFSDVSKCFFDLELWFH